MNLHIGSKGPAIPGFKKVDIVQWGDVDYVRDARDLACFADNSIRSLYCSHILEHFNKHETCDVLKEWCRVLEPGGYCWIAVPSFDAIVELYLKSGKVLGTWIDHLMHGDQSTPQDFHYRCFTFPILAGLMSQAGFQRVDKLEVLPYNVEDASHYTDNRFGIRISLCVRGVK